MKRQPKPHTPSTIQWVDAPPPSKHLQGGKRQGRMVMFVELLKTKPNKWAVYDNKYNNCTIVPIAKKKFPKTEWTSRSNKDGKTFTIYARYIGK